MPRIDGDSAVELRSSKMVETPVHEAGVEEMAGMVNVGENDGEDVEW